MIKKLLAFVIIFLFIGTSIVSSTEKIDEELCFATNFNGSLSGYIRNISGGSIEGAQVRVYFHNTYEQDYSDKEGYYQVKNISLCKCLKIGKCSNEDYKTKWAKLVIHENTVHDFILTFTEGFIENVDQSEEKISPNNHPLDTIEMANSASSRGKIAYAYIVYGLTEGPCYFDLDDPGTITSFTISDLNFSGFICGTWTNYGKWLVCNSTGALWEINLCYGLDNVLEIGGGGVCLYSLSYNPMNDKLYGVTSSDLYEIDMSTGEQTHIGNFGLTGITIIAIAIDLYGQAFIWNVLYSGTSHLWTVDLESGEATFYADLGVNLIYAQDGSFDWETNILWLAAYSSSGYLAYWDDEAKELVHMGNFQSGAELCALTIPRSDDYCPPNTTISIDPPEPDGENGWYVNDVNITLNATDNMSGVRAIYYKIPGEDWKNQVGDSIKILLDHDCLTGLFKFFSIDNASTQEEIKSADIDIDQEPPYIQLCYEVKEGNPIKGWPVIVTAYVTDNCSGMDRVEFYLNDGLQSTVSGAGPIYQWNWIYFGDLEIKIGANCFDIAGNSAYYEIPFKSNQNSIQSLFHPLFFRLFERFPLLLRL